MTISDKKILATLSVLQEAADLGEVVLASSLSAEDMVLTHLIATHKLPISIFAINTGMLHDETLALIDTTKVQYGIDIAVYHPDHNDVASYISENGKHAFYESLELRHSCCNIRKVEPLNRALQGRAGWITGQRREQASTRTELLAIEADTQRGIEKFNPLADWTWSDVLEFAQHHDIPINPLHTRGYPSIGCAPCTRAVRSGEDARAGRWWWEQSDTKECGLHVKEAFS